MFAGEQLAVQLRSGDVVALYGDLGTGKTRFVKGVCKGLGLGEHVTSPTFTIVNEYIHGRLPVYHFDFYRMRSINELEEIGFDEYVYGDGICVLEWADMIEKKLPLQRYDVHFQLGEQETERIIEIEKIIPIEISK